MNKNTVQAIAVAVIMAAAGNVMAVMDYGPKFWSPSGEVVTPHITWSKPDAQGQLKALFIIYRDGMREVVELAQRLDLQYTVFSVGNEDKPLDFCGTNSPEIRLPDRVRDADALTEDILEKLKDSHDVIVLGNVNWSSFPMIVRARILEKVNEGASLLGVVPKQDDYFKKATAKKEKLNLQALIPYKGLPAFAGYKDVDSWLNATVEYSRFGKGKILVLKGFKVPRLQALTPEPAGNALEPRPVEYDYYLAWIGHLLQFTSGRPAMATIKGADYAVMERDNPDNLKYIVSGPDGKPGVCSFALRNDDNQVVAARERKITLTANGINVDFKVPQALPAGRYFADLWVKKGGKVLTYGSSFVELKGSRTIEAVDLKTYYGRDDKVTGKVTVIARKSTADGLTLLLRQRDTYGRITAKSCIDLQPLKSDEALETTIELAGGSPLTIVQYLEVELRKGEEVLDRKKKAFSISDLLSKENVKMIGWCDAWPSYLSGYMFSELAKAGFDAQYGPQPGRFSETPFLANVRHVPYATRIVDRKSRWGGASPVREKTDHIRKPCLTDPSYRRELAEILTKCAEQHLPFSTDVCSVGDECLFSEAPYELCFSPTCVAAFHKFLAVEYQTVEAMDREYGTQYKTFEEVRPVTLEEAKQKGLEPLWVDYRRHMENVWAEIFSYCAEIVHKTLPAAKVGYEGSNATIDSYDAANYWKLMQAMTLNSLYDGAFVPYAVMSFARPGTMLGLGWCGGYNGMRYPEFQRYVAWRHLFRGANSYWIFTSGPCEPHQSIMAPDLSLYDFFKAKTTEVMEIKNGIGKLLMTSRRVDDGVAVLYSAASVHVSTLTEGLPPSDKVLNALTPLFEDAGIQFRIISSEQLAQGDLKKDVPPQLRGWKDGDGTTSSRSVRPEVRPSPPKTEALQKDGFRLLWLPYAQSLSRHEADEVESFVNAGGTVVADLRPGVRDEHGKPYDDRGVLDEVFGVKQRTKAPLAGKHDAVAEKWPFELKCDLSLKLETGKSRAALEPAAGVPALIKNDYGKGKAVLLNFSLSDYAQAGSMLAGAGDQRGREAQNIVEFFKTLMAQLGVEEAVRFAPTLPRARTYRFASGKIVYLGILQELPESPGAYLNGTAKPLTPQTTVLTLDTKKHVYDARAGKYLGFSDRIETSIEPARGMLFALLPYQMGKIILNVRPLEDQHPPSDLWSRWTGRLQSKLEHYLNAPKRIARGETLEYEAAIEGVEQPGLHVFHVELISPKGEKVPWYADNMVVENGQGKGAVSMALNDKIGKWRISIRDAATGATVEKTFILEERKEK